MSQRNISVQIKNLYNVEISDGLVSKIVEKITSEITAWRNRPLDDVYSFVFMDAIHCKVKENYQYITKAACVVLGIQMDGYNDIKALMADLQKACQALNEDEVLNALIEFKEKWQKTYPSCVKGREENRNMLSAFFAYPAEVHKIIYTTNIIEGMNECGYNLVAM